MTKETTILSTKVLLPNQKQALLNANIFVVEEDFIATTHFLPSFEQLGENLIFTSQNAVQSILKHPKCAELKNKNVFSVGMKTKDLLTENGFKVEVYTDYAADLAEIISLIYNTETYTFFSGNLRRDVLPNTLKENKISYNEIVVYETIISPKKITASFDSIMFFSPSGVESYLKLNAIKNEICFCIGETTAEALEKKGIKNIEIAQIPSIESVIEKVISLPNSSKGGAY